MAGQKFEYDESGSTFFYFLISVLGLVLVPCTFYFWPSEKPTETKAPKTDECRCDSCQRKEARLKKPEKWKGIKKSVQRFFIVIGWICMAFLVYKVQEFDYEYANFDPWDILGVSMQASQTEIKKAYRKQSLVYHPDKPTGDERKFMKLNKAYQALTDDVARRNYELYGNPDGPGAMHFGIALPSWIVEKENSLWVLGLYGLVFMIGLPTVVAIWWYRSSKFSNDQVLLDTTQLYLYFFHKTPTMVFKRALMVLAASLEFEKGHNPEIVERPEDNIQLPHLMKQLTNLGEKNMERPLCFPYSIKARALLHAHLSRSKLLEDTLDIDRYYIVKCCPGLIQEMVTCVAQLIMLAHAGRISRLPSLDTIEATMKLSPHIVQALWDSKSAVLQLPHLTDESMRYFVTKQKKPIKSIQQFVHLANEERRHILRTFTDEQYENLMKVAAKFPDIQMSVKYEVVDDDDSGVFTAGAIVTVTVGIFRRSLRHSINRLNVQPCLNTQLVEHQSYVEELNNEESKDINNKKSGWKKPQQKKGGKSKSKSQVVKKKAHQIHSNKKEEEEKKEEEKKERKDEDKKERKDEDKRDRNTIDRIEDVERTEDSDEDDSVSHSDESMADEGDTESHREEKQNIDEDAEWDKFQKGLTKREKCLEGKSKLSHSVHCPYYPEDKQEYWWTYVCDRKKRMLITAPYQITNLVEQEEVQLKFTAPHKPGVYSYQVCLRSDSYVGVDVNQDIKLDVKEAREIPTEHPQWEECSSDPDEDEQDENVNNQDGNESEYTTDEELTDDGDE